MSLPSSVKVRAQIVQTHPQLAAYVVIPARAIAGWALSGTTTVEGSLAGEPFGRRSIGRLDARRWFVELRRDFLEKVGKSPGDRVQVELRLASTELPPELSRLISEDAAARKRWSKHTPAQQRMLREHVLGAKSSETRDRRARRALLPDPPLPKPPVRGLRSAARAIRLRIEATRLPGRACGSWRDIEVGLVQKVGCPPEARISADRADAAWETTVQVRDQDGAPAFRGPAVNGPPRERFLYLTWIGRTAGEAPAMFRRAKLRLDAIPASVLAAALRSGELVGRLALTGRDGTPVCGSVRPPAISWSA